MIHESTPADPPQETDSGRAASIRPIIIRGMAAAVGFAIGAALLYAVLAAGPGQEVVEARAVILRDDEGRKRAELSVQDDWAGLFLYDESGRRRASLAGVGEWMALVLYDTTGEELASLRGHADGTTVLDLSGRGPGRGIELAVPSEGVGWESLTFYDDGLDVLWQAPYSFAMRRGLAAVSVEQEHYFSLRNTYASSISELAAKLPQGVEARILEAGPTGWAGEATHSAFPGRSCVMYVGTGVMIPATAGEGPAPDGPIDLVCDSR